MSNLCLNCVEIAQRCNNKFLNDDKRRAELLKAVLENKEKFLNKMEKDDALLNYKFPSHDNRTILAIACSSLEVMEQTLEILISKGAKCNERSGSNNWGPLHYAAMRLNTNKLKMIVEKLEPEELSTLVYCPKTETFSNNALHILLKYNEDKDCVECCKLLIDKEIDARKFDSSGVSPVALFRKSLVTEVKNLEEHLKSKGCTRNSFDLLAENNLKNYKNSFDNEEEQYSSCTLLQLCCLKEYDEIIKKMPLNKDEMDKCVEGSDYPIVIAMYHDHSGLVDSLLAKYGPDLPEDLLLKLVMKCGIASKIDIVFNYVKILFNHIMLNYSDENRSGFINKFLNSDDYLGRTALHYSTYYDCDEITLYLLSKGACLLKEDKNFKTPLDWMNPACLEDILDGCIATKENKKYLKSSAQKSIAIVINYDRLLSESSFESKFLYHINNEKKFQHLVLHPVVNAFILLKWLKYRKIAFLNLIIYMIAYVTLICDWFFYAKNNNVSSYFVVITLTLIILRELFLLVIFRTGYFRKLENVIDSAIVIALIISLLYLITSKGNEGLRNQNYFMFYSIALLCSTFGIFIELGNFSTFTVKVAMLKHIVLTFFRYMSLYLIPIFAFALCFYILKEDNEDTLLDVVYLSLVMYSGSTEADYVEQFSKNPIFGRIVYIIFVFLICIVLNNMLVGLAVSDMQEIGRKAKYMVKTGKVDYVYNFEKVIWHVTKRKEKQGKAEKEENLLEKLLHYFTIFENDKQIVVKHKWYKFVSINHNQMWDNDIVTYLKNRKNNAAIGEDRNKEINYSFKSLYDKLERLEKVISSIKEDQDSNV